MARVIGGFYVNSAEPIDLGRSFVKTLAERDAIDVNRRYEDMETYVRQTKTKYQLQGGITNAHWVPLKNSSIPDFAFNSLDELRAVDVSQIGDSAVDVWLYPTNQIFEWDAFSTAPDNNTTVIKPAMLTDEQAGRFVFKTELAPKNHNHEIEHVNGLTDELDNKAPLVHAHDLNPAQFGNGLQVVDGKAELGGELTKETVISAGISFDLNAIISDGNIYSAGIVNENKAIIIGSFTTISDVSAKYIAVFNLNGIIDEELTNTLLNSCSFGINYKILKYGVKTLIVGFDNELVNGKITSIVVLNEDFTIDDTIVIETDNSIKDAIIDNDKLIIGGIFTTLYIGENEYIIGKIARLNSDFSLDEKFNQGGSGFTGLSSGSVVKIKSISNNRIAVSTHRLSAYNNVAQNYGLHILNQDGSEDITFNAKAISSGYIRDFYEKSTGHFVIGGTFLNYDSVSTPYFAILDASGNLCQNAFGITTVFDSGITGLIPTTNGCWVFGMFTAIVTNDITTTADGIAFMRDLIPPFLVHDTTINSEYSDGGSMTSKYIVNSNYNGEDFWFICGQKTSGLYSIKEDGALKKEVTGIVLDGNVIKYKTDLTSKITDLSLIHKRYLDGRLKSYTTDVASGSSYYYVRINGSWVAVSFGNNCVILNGDSIELGGQLKKETSLSATQNIPLFSKGLGSACSTNIIKPLSDGSLILYVSNFKEFNGTTYCNGQLSLIKLKPNGMIDESFGVFVNGSINSITVDETDNIYISTQSKSLTNYLTGEIINGGSVISLTKDGKLNSNYAISSDSFLINKVIKDIVYQNGKLYYHLGGLSIFKTDLNGNDDLGYYSNVSNYLSATQGSLNNIIPISNNRVIIVGTLYKKDGTNQGAVIIHEDGTEDETFYFKPRVTHITMGVVELSNGGFFMTGVFYDDETSEVIFGIFVNSDGSILENGAVIKLSSVSSNCYEDIIEISENTILWVGSFSGTINGTRISKFAIFNSSGITSSYSMPTSGNGFLRLGKMPNGNIVLGGTYNSWVSAPNFSTLTSNVYGPPYVIDQITYYLKLRKPQLRCDFIMRYESDVTSELDELSFAHKKYVDSKFKKKDFTDIPIIIGTTTLTHNFNQRAVRATVYDADWNIMPVNIKCINETQIEITSTTEYTATVVVEG